MPDFKLSFAIIPDDRRDGAPENLLLYRSAAAPSLTRDLLHVIIIIAFAPAGAALSGRAFQPSGGTARHSIIFIKEDTTMSEVCGSVHVGDQVPDFEMEIFDPVKKDFGKISLKKLKAAKKWTVLFFYPADFTFV